MCLNMLSPLQPAGGSSNHMVTVSLQRLKHQDMTPICQMWGILLPVSMSALSDRQSRGPTEWGGAGWRAGRGEKG